MSKDLYEVTGKEDSTIAQRAADLKKRHVEDVYGAGHVNHESYNRFLNLALRYTDMPLEKLRDKTGPIATYVMGAREARGDK